MITPVISYKKIGDAISFYENHGYSYRETSWIVSFEAYRATKPEQRPDFFTLGGYLVASGEQGFIEELLQHKKLTKHSTVTPCFREEEVFDQIHYNYFLKVELIDTDATYENLKKMIEVAAALFRKKRGVYIMQTDSLGEAFDIIDTKSDVELGSYGIRRLPELPPFIYGTGLAEPRYSFVCNHYL